MTEVKLYLELLVGSAGFTEDLVVVDHSLFGPQQSDGRVSGVDGVQRPGGGRLCSKHQQTQINVQVKAALSRVSADTTTNALRQRGSERNQVSHSVSGRKAEETDDA